MVTMEDLIADNKFFNKVETRSYMQRLMDDANEVAGVSSEATETVEKATRFKNMMDDFYVTLDEILEGAGAGRGQKEISAHVLNTHHKLSNKLDNLLSKYDEMLNTSIRGEQQNLMLNALNLSLIHI